MSDQPARQKKVLTLLFFGVLMGALDIAIVGPALPAIRSGMGISERATSWIFTSFVLTNLVGTPLMAKLSDVLGRRSVYVADILLFGAGSLVVALAPSFTVLIIGRAVQGFGSGGIFPVASAVIGDTFPPEKRGSALGLIGAVFGIAFLIGPIIGGVLLLAGWRWLFVVNLPIAAVLVVASLRVLPGRTAAAAGGGKFDWGGVVLISVALTALTLALSSLDTHQLWRSLTSPEVWPLLAVAVVFTVVFGLAETRAPDPLLRPALVVRRQVALAAIFSFGAGLGEAAFVYLPSYTKQALGVSESTASFMLLAVVFAMALGSPVAGRLVDKLGSRLVVLVGLVIFACGLSLFSHFGHSFALFYTASALMGLGLASLLGAPLRYILLAEASDSERGAAQALLTLFTGTGQLFGAALLGAIIASATGSAGYHEAFLALAVVAAAFALLALGLKGRHAERRGVSTETEAEATSS